MKRTRTTLCGLVALAGLLTLPLSIGCTKTHGGHYSVAQRPNPDVVYFEPGPEFKLTKEAEARRLAAEEQASAQANSPAEAAAQETKR